MTESTRTKAKFFGALLLLLLFLSRSTLLLEATRAALRLTATTILPSLFPYLVLSGILSAAAVGLSLPGGRLFSRLFRLPAPGLLALLLGSLCGFPVGVAVTAELCKCGAISREEAARTAALSANTGPAFAVAAVGGAMFGDTAFGWWLYGIQILLSLLFGLVAARRYPIPVSSATAVAPAPRPFTEILYHASLSMIKIVAAVVFFGSLAALPGRHLSPSAAAAVASLLEVGNGTGLAAALPPKIGRPIAAFALSFSGLSVLMQSAALLEPLGVEVRPLALRKLLQGGTAAFLAVLFL